MIRTVYIETTIPSCWNCQHLANANKTQHLSILNGRLGLPVPVITTPLSLLPEMNP